MISPQVGRSTFAFTEVEHLLQLGRSELFAPMMKSLKCLMTIAESESSEEISRLVDFASGLPVYSKHLLVLTSSLNETWLLNKSINYNVIIIIERGIHVY